MSDTVPSLRNRGPQSQQPITKEPTLMRSDIEDKELQELIAQNEQKNGVKSSIKQRLVVNQSPDITAQDLLDISDDLPVKLDPTKGIITNEIKDPNLPINPPKISPEQMRRYKNNNPEPESPMFAGKPRFIMKRIDTNPKFTRLGLVSGFVFYPFKECLIRKISIQDHFNITYAMNTNNITNMIDAIGATLDQSIDIRDLTIPDFFHILYWHRFNSYSSVPMSITWTSKYGNKNIYKVTESSVKYNPPKITEEEYKVWTDAGFGIPTVRDLEVFRNEELTPDETELFERAQYFSGYHSEFDASSDKRPDIQDKIDHMVILNSDDVSILARMPEFVSATVFGINEKIEVVDAKFNPLEWMNILTTQAESRKANLLDLPLDGIEYIEESQNIETLLNEVEEITAMLEKGDEVTPDVEIVSLNVGILDFFPKI